MRLRPPLRVVIAVAALASVLPVGGASSSPVGRAMSCKPVEKTARELVCAVPLPPEVKVRSANVRVLLPADYARSRRSYPVVYMLHGVGDDEKAWTNPARGDLGRLTASCNAIFVMPDGGSGPVAGWYSDWADGSYQYERYHALELDTSVHRTFRTTGRRAVAGMSMGGFGALKYAARHPLNYRAVASYSGFVDTMFGAPVSGEVNDVGGQNPAYSTGAPSRRVWGTQAEKPDVWRAHNPYDLAERLRGMPLYLSSGNGLPGGPLGEDASKGPNYAVEAYIGQLNNRFAARLGELGVPFTDARYAGGYHDWAYWRAAFTDSLRILMPPIGATSRGCGA